MSGIDDLDNPWDFKLQDGIINVPEGFLHLQLPVKNIAELHRYNQIKPEETSFLSGMIEGLSTFFGSHTERPATETGRSFVDRMAMPAFSLTGSPSADTIMLPDVLRAVKEGLKEFSRRNIPMSGSNFLQILIDPKVDKSTMNYVLSGDGRGFYGNFINRMMLEFTDALERSRGAVLA